MKKSAVAAFAALALIVAAAPSGAETTDHPCADLFDGTDSYGWSLLAGEGTFSLDVQLAGYVTTVGEELSTVSCQLADVETYDHTLYVIADHPAEDLLSGAAMAVVSDDELAGAVAVPNSGASFDENVGTSIVSWDVAVADDDPTVCVLVEAARTVMTTTPNEPVDLNGNGTTSDDQHKQNEGSNKDKTKHGWGSTTTTSTEVLDVAPNADDAGNSRCFFVTAPPFVIPEVGGGGARGYN